jgi:hypothetical protein
MRGMTSVHKRTIVPNLPHLPRLCYRYVYSSLPVCFDMLSVDYGNYVVVELLVGGLNASNIKLVLQREP